jgi:hypothetical protein
VQLSLRVTPEMYEAIKAVATVERRSINRQLELMIEEALEQRRREREEREGPQQPG